MVPMWQTLVETVGERTPTSPGTQLLDLASGPGNPSLQLAKAYPGLAVRCTDASEDMVEKAKGLAKDMGVEGGWRSSCLTCRISLTCRRPLSTP